MSEDEWLNSTDPGTLMKYVASLTTDRKLHHYAIGCCRRIACLLPNPASLAGVDVLEKFSDGQATASDVHEMNYHVEGAAFGFDYHPSPLFDPRVESWISEAEMLPLSLRNDLFNNSTYHRETAHQLLNSAAYFADETVNSVPWERRMAEWPYMIENRSFQFVPFIRDIFGNPFRPVPFDPAWRTSTAVGVARAMYDARAFAAMPILADALQDAGCEDDAILHHCRDEKQVHVRGCWVVDLVLGKS